MFEYNKGDFDITETWKTYNEFNKCVFERRIHDTTHGMFRYVHEKYYYRNEQNQPIDTTSISTEYEMDIYSNPDHPQIKKTKRVYHFKNTYNENNKCVHTFSIDTGSETFYKYDDNGHKIERTIPKCDFKEIFVYNDKNQMIEYHMSEYGYSMDSVSQFDDNGNEVYRKTTTKSEYYCDTSETIQIFDDNNKLIERRILSDDGCSCRYKHFYEYNDKGLLVHEYGIDYDCPDRNNNIMYDYDDNGNMIHSIEYNTQYKRQHTDDEYINDNKNDTIERMD